MEDEKALLLELYRAWRLGKPRDRERALYEAVQAGALPQVAEKTLQQLQASHPSPLLSDRSALLVPTLAAAIALEHDPDARKDLDDLARIIRVLHHTYTPDRRTISLDEVARQLALRAGDLDRLINLGGLQRDADGLHIPTDALFWIQFEDFLARTIHRLPRVELETEPPLELPIAASPTTVSWQNVGPFREVTTLQIAPITVLVGANGSGKTTALIALAMLRDVATRGLESLVPYQDRLSHGADEVMLEAGAELEREGAPAIDTVSWQLVVARTRPPHVRWESLRRARHDGSLEDLGLFLRGSGRWRDARGSLVEHTMRPDELALRAADEPANHWRWMAMRQHLARWQIQLAAPPIEPSPLGPFHALRFATEPLWLRFQSDPAAFEILRQHARAVTGIDDLALQSARLMIRDRGSPPVPVALASMGIVRAIQILAGLFAPEPPPLLAIDEIENHLHGDLVARLIDVMRSVAHRTRVVLTTHSGRVLRCVTPDEVRLVTRGDSTSTIISISDDLRLRKLVRAGSLDEMIEAGYFAGRL